MKFSWLIILVNNPTHRAVAIMRNTSLEALEKMFVRIAVMVVASVVMGYAAG